MPKVRASSGIMGTNARSDGFILKQFGKHAGEGHCGGYSAVTGAIQKFLEKFQRGRAEFILHRETLWQVSAQFPAAFLKIGYFRAILIRFEKGQVVYVVIG